MSQISWSMTADLASLWPRDVEQGLVGGSTSCPGSSFIGWMQLFTNREMKAIRECEQALEPDRDLAYAHAMIGFAKVLLVCGRKRGSHPAGVPLSPRDINAHRWMHKLGVAKLILGADAEAVEWLRRSLEANRNYPIVHFQLAAALALVGSMDEARASVLAGFALDPAFTIRRTKGLTLSPIRPFAPEATVSAMEC